jgi:glycosyltransferase involved in cell wall biosynthesis
VKVLLVQPYGKRLGHFSQYTKEIAGGLVRRGHRVTVVTSVTLANDIRLAIRDYVRVEESSSTAEVESVHQFSRWGSVREVVYGLAVMRECFRALKTVHRLIRAEEFDVVHFLDFEQLLMYVWLAGGGVRGAVGRPKLALVVHPADFDYRRHRSNPIRAVYKTITRFTLAQIIRRHADVATVHGDWIRAELARDLDLTALTAAKLHTVPYGMSMDEPLDRAKARRTLGIQYDGPILLQFGMLRPDKGIQELIRALGHCKDRDFRLIVAGTPAGINWEELVALAQKVGCSDRLVGHPHYVPDEMIPVYFSAADFVTLPYRGSFTGASGPLTLACTYRKPVLVSRTGEMGDLAEKHGLGVVIDPDAPNELVDGLRKLLDMTQDEQNAIRQRMANVIREYAWDQMAEKFSRLYGIDCSWGSS